MTLTKGRLHLAVLSTGYEIGYRPQDTKEASFWTGTEDERTFFVAGFGPDIPFLILSKDDVRSLGMRTPTDQEKATIEEVGLDPASHLTWSVEPKYLTEKGSEPEVNEEVERLNTKVESLRAEINRMASELSDARYKHQQDIDIIGERLVEECTTRDWCEEFDRIIDELNGRLNRSLPNMCREKDYEVTVDVTVRVSRTVTAESEDEAYDRAVEDINEHTLSEGDIRDYDHVETEEV